MLPKTMHKLPQLQRLHVYAGAEHPFKNVFPNQPPAKKASEVIIPTTHFKVHPEAADALWKKAEPIPPNSKGVVDFIQHVRSNHPDAFANLVADAEVRMTADQYQHYMRQSIERQKLISKEKIIGHKYDLKKKYNFEYL